MNYALCAFIISSISILISLYLLFVELYRRNRNPHLSINGITLIDAHVNTIYLLLHVAIVNNSSIAKTIYQMSFQPLENFHIDEVPGEQNFEQSLVTFRPLGSSGKAILVRLEDTASFPLDIEPHHSKLAFLAIGVHPISLEQYEHQKIKTNKTFGYIEAFDYHHKRIAKVDLSGPI